MCANLKCIIIGILDENGSLSLTLTIAIAAYASFFAPSFYLIYRGETWGNYDTFASLTAGGGSALHRLNKFINSKYNSPADEFP